MSLFDFAPVLANRIISLITIDRSVAIATGKQEAGTLG